MNKEPIIFIDTEDMEERYAESLYMDYLKEENEQLKDRINKAIEFIGNNTPNLSNAEIYDLLEILKGDNNDN